jgi:hypothetical protein
MDAGAKRIEYLDGDNQPVCCPTLTHVMAAYRPVPNQIGAWCEHAKFVKFLNIGRYGHEFNIAPKKVDPSKQPTWYRVNERRRFEILGRDGFACVWCREPIAEDRITEVRAEALGATPGQFDASLDWEFQDVDRVFFGHDADHLFTISDYTVLQSHLKRDALNLIAKEWIVTSCERCNRGRRSQPFSARALIAIYARHLFERSGKPDWDELATFSQAARLLGMQRSQPQSTGTAG